MAEHDRLTGVDPEEPARDYFLNEALVQHLTIFNDGTSELTDHLGAGQEHLFENVKKRASLAGKLAAIYERPALETPGHQNNDNSSMPTEPGINLAVLTTPTKPKQASATQSDPIVNEGRVAIAEFCLAERPGDGSEDANLRAVFRDFLGDKPGPDVIIWIIHNHHRDNLDQEFFVDPESWRAGASEGSGIFFTKWSRHVRQSREQWKAEQRIRSGKPYDMDIAGDPGLKGIPTHASRGNPLFAEATTLFRREEL